MDEIDWDFWRNLDHLFIWQVGLLTLGFNPEGLDYSFNPTHLYNQDSSRIRIDYSFNPTNFHNQEIMRIRFDSSFNWKNHNEAAFKKRHSIIHSNRDVGLYTFGIHEVNLKIFIEWVLQNKSFEIPNQLLTRTGHIEPKQQLYSPEEWHSLAEKYAVDEFKNNPKILQDALCKVIREKFKRDNILSSRGKTPVISSIKAYLSDSSFAKNRNWLQNK